MSRTSNRAGGDIVQYFLSVADLLEEPQLAQLYSYLAREGEATVQDVMDDLELAHGTAYSYVNRLVDAGVTTGVHPAGFAAGCLYMAACAHDAPLTQAAAAAAAGVTVETVRNHRDTLLSVVE